MSQESEVVKSPKSKYSAKTIDMSLFTGSEKYIYKDNCNYNEIYSIDNFYDRGLEACKNVRWKRSTTEFEVDMLCIIDKVLTQIFANTYRAQPFNNFIINERGKTRQISAQKITDRMVQKVVNQDVMLAIYQENFVDGNSASMKGKGKQYAIDTLIEQLKAHYAIYGTQGGILLGDYSNYFGSLPHEELKRRIRERITDQKTVKILCDAITDFRKIAPCHKVEGWGYAGIGLGSEVSQTFALDYGSPLDHYIEDNFKITGYGRYMDDFYIICDSLETLQKIKEIIISLVEETGTSLSEKKTQIVPLKAHSFCYLKMDFLFSENGALIITPTHRNAVVIRRRLNKFYDMLQQGFLTIEDICASYNGWRANIATSKHHYRTLYNADLYFTIMFRKFLATRNKPFKCYIKAQWNKGIKQWEYITKDLEGSKSYSKQIKKHVKEKEEKWVKIKESKDFKMWKKPSNGRFKKIYNNKDAK